MQNKGEASGIEDKSRRAESYLTDDLTLDWTRCKGQRYFLQRAKEFGCQSIVTFQQYPSCTIYLQRKRILQ